ncbi:hypothetical protein J4Q44_G00009160 [Coregonus suidteri]|uniref:Uncharacterized protein n=1 Tax=Coregonus suidteri TaxID=861788 RepID=A0AAN8R9A2_9TELE
MYRCQTGKDSTSQSHHWSSITITVPNYTAAAYDLIRAFRKRELAERDNLSAVNATAAPAAAALATRTGDERPGMVLNQAFVEWVLVRKRPLLRDEPRDEPLPPPRPPLHRTGSHSKAKSRRHSQHVATSRCSITRRLSVWKQQDKT